MPALQDVNFVADSGKFVAVVGPSAVEKPPCSTSLPACNLLHVGSVLGRATDQGPGRNRAMVFQSAALLPWRTILRNVTYGLELQKYPKKRMLEIARELIQLVGLNGFEECYPRELSGGMQQRVNLARA